jgi:hypothetical protein
MRVPFGSVVVALGRMRLAAMEQPALRGLSPTRLAACDSVCCRVRAARWTGMAEAGADTRIYCKSYRLRKS